MYQSLHLLLLQAREAAGHPYKAMESKCRHGTHLVRRALAVAHIIISSFHEYCA